MEAQGLAHTLSFLYLDTLQRVIMIFLLDCFITIGTLIVVRNPAGPQLKHLVVKNVEVELQFDVAHEDERFYLPLHFCHLLGDDQLLVDCQLGLAIDASQLSESFLGSLGLTLGTLLCFCYQSAKHAMELLERVISL